MGSDFPDVDTVQHEEYSTKGSTLKVYGGVQQVSQSKHKGVKRV